MNYKEIAKGLQFPEGPIFCSDGTLLVVEIARGTLTRVHMDGRLEIVADLGGGPNGAAIGPDGQCYVCNNGGYTWIIEDGRYRPAGVLNEADYCEGSIQVVDVQSGGFEVTVTHSELGPLAGPNDIAFDRAGGYWFTDTGKAWKNEQTRGAVHYVPAGTRKISETIHPLVMPNGIGLSANETELFIAETVTGRLWGFDLVASGRLARRPWPSPTGGRLVAGLPGLQNLDSLALDAAENIVVATLMRGGLSVISSQGALLDFVELDDPYVSNICFGGCDNKTAFVTMSYSGRVVAIDWPYAGLALPFSI